MIFRERQFFAYVDQCQLCAIGEHRLNGGGTDWTQDLGVRQSEE
jgi:hypothetical protein